MIRPRLRDNQQIIAQEKARRCRGPSRIGIEHRHDHWHISPTDGHHEMGSDQEGDQGQKDQSPQAGMAHESQTEKDTPNNADEVEQMATWQGKRFTVQRSLQFAKSDDRTCERNRTDEYPKHDFNLVNDHSAPARSPGGAMAELMPMKTAARPTKRMQGRNQLRHASHFDPLSDNRANCGPAIIIGINNQKLPHRSRKQRGADRQCHADDAVPNRSFALPDCSCRRGTR